jgi:hypothetical protein
LDDNALFCLPNGERIRLDPARVRLLFEVEDLVHASPATVSRWDSCFFKVVLLRRGFQASRLDQKGV